MARRWPVNSVVVSLCESSPIIRVQQANLRTEPVHLRVGGLPVPEGDSVCGSLLSCSPASSVQLGQPKIKVTPGCRTMTSEGISAPSRSLSNVGATYLGLVTPRGPPTTKPVQLSAICKLTGHILPHPNRVSVPPCLTSLSSGISNPCLRATRSPFGRWLHLHPKDDPPSPIPPCSPSKYRIGARPTGRDGCYYQPVLKDCHVLDPPTRLCPFHPVHFRLL